MPCFFSPVAAAVVVVVSLVSSSKYLAFIPAVPKFLISSKRRKKNFRKESFPSRCQKKVSSLVPVRVWSLGWGSSFAPCAKPKCWARSPPSHPSTTMGNWLVFTWVRINRTFIFHPGTPMQEQKPSSLNCVPVAILAQSKILSFPKITAASSSPAPVPTFVFGTRWTAVNCCAFKYPI